MSRIGKTPVLIPDKVTVNFDGLTVTVKGPKGELKRLMPEGVSFDKKDNTVVVSPTTTKIYSRQRHGLCRALIANMVEGCLLYTSPSPRDDVISRMPSSA